MRIWRELKRAEGRRQHAPLGGGAFLPSPITYMSGSKFAQGLSRALD